MKNIIRDQKHTGNGNTGPGGGSFPQSKFKIQK
jgi:hypothetical protein